MKCRLFVTSLSNKTLCMMSMPKSMKNNKAVGLNPSSQYQESSSSKNKSGRHYVRYNQKPR